MKVHKFKVLLDQWPPTYPLHGVPLRYDDPFEPADG